MRIVVWGCGNCYLRYKEYIYRHEVIAIVDNDSTKQGSHVDGVIIINPSMLRELYYERIYICTADCNAVKAQLAEMGVDNKKIFYFWDFDQKKNDFDCWENPDFPKEGKQKIALISHEYTTTGAPNCLLTVARWLINKSYKVIVGSPYDGILRQTFFDLGADVYVDRRLRMGNMDSIEWIQECDLIFVNTAQLFYLLRRKNTGVPTIWWLHEPDCYYVCVDKNVVSEIDYSNLQVYSVSEVADRAFAGVCDGVIPKRLLYGIQDERDKSINAKREGINRKIRFVVVGHVSRIKGHDLLMEAIEKLHQQNPDDFEVVCVGKNNSIFAKNLIEKSHREGLPIIFKGEMKRSETINIIAEADALICCSMIESMSVSVTEALMMEKPVIVSSSVGNTQYIEDGINGYIFESEDADSLVAKMYYMMINIHDIENVKKMGRRTFESHFSESIFESNLENILLPYK